MTLTPLSPRKALNKAFLKVKPNRTDIEVFKSNLIALLDRSNDTESEEFHKNLVSDFLKKTYYEPNHFINTKGRNDLVIHNGDKASSTVGVILEAKKPTNKGEMIAAGNINKKAFQELVLYYLRERITHKNLEVKYLIITNINEWFIFDATTFDRLFAQNKALVGQFTDFEEGRLSETKTDFFYKQIAEPFIAKISAEIEFTYFNLQDYQKPLRNDDPSDDHKLIALFKLLSPEHLLKKPFANDSNSLDKRFYSELLHIIGLTETKEGGKKLIQRNQENDRNTGSILEDAIIQLDSLDKLSRLSNLNQFGSTTQDRLFNVALELSITWINRILFLKLLEAQLLSYNNGDASYAFLNFERIRSYDDLNSLFFQVLARKHEDRNADVKNTFAQVPYLNSSLFEPTEIEQDTLFISNLRDDKQLPILSNTVLKDQNGKKRSGKLGTLEYLFEFLNAYDFGAEGSEEIQEDNKTLINASVLGLIFEKINGYKDGSFFTPGFITMYMCRETIRKAVVQKFNEAKAEKNKAEELNNYESFTDVYNAIGSRRDFSHEEAAALVNNIKICDPAVGSGHFLVSALNEMIAVKHELGILADREGKFIRDYDIAVENDELVITDANGELFEYKPNNKESQRIQETLFHEKQSIIENCLFGVDINPNSVKICRLRLWIELLKNAYYTKASFDSAQPTLETLPNIDINIKCGNSLVSRFAIDSDLNQALKQSKWNIESYRMAVSTYRTAQNKEQKREMERLIADIKSDFRSNIDNPFKKRISVVRGKVDKLATEINTQQQWGEKPSKQLTKELETATAQLKKLEQEKDEIENNKIFENAFEWRFEFPEVLDNDGRFVGFDVVIGNPPYINLERDKSFSDQVSRLGYLTYNKRGDLYCLFVEMGFTILRNHGLFTYIFPNKWMQAGYGKELRKYLLQYDILLIADFGDIQVFDEATTYPCILVSKKEKKIETIAIANISSVDSDSFSNHILDITEKFLIEQFNDETWITSSFRDNELVSRLTSTNRNLREYLKGDAFYGIKFGLTEAFVINHDLRSQFIKDDNLNLDLIGPLLRGRNLKPYTTPKEVDNDYLILAYFGSHKIIENKYPSIYRHLVQFEEKLKKRGQCLGSKPSLAKPYPGQHHWLELDNNPSLEYLEMYKMPKIMYQSFQVKPCFIYDEDGLYCNNSMWFIPSDDKVLLGILNSKMGWWLISKYCSAIQNGYQLIWKYFSQIPIATGNDKSKMKIVELVDQILTAKKQSPTADTSALESEIDRLVYELYGLTEEEVKIVEGV
jgi:adenine-specific DNA-methyltransferase